MKKKTQLFLFHFAGGNAYSYKFMFSFMNEFELVPLELPGRNLRIDEKCLINFDLAARDLYTQVIRKMTSPDFFIYGHSMGALLGFRVAKMLEQNGTPPLYLFVTGSCGPGIKKKQRHLLERVDLINELRNLGGFAPEILENKEVMDFLIPMLRADLEIAEKDELKKELPLHTPIYVIMGNDEEHVDKILNWKNYTLSECRTEIFDGGHFFILNYPQRIAALLQQLNGQVNRLYQQT